MYEFKHKKNMYALPYTKLMLDLQLQQQSEQAAGCRVDGDVRMA